MKFKSKIKMNMNTMVIGFFVVIMIIFAFIIEMIGYFGFTQSFTSEYYDTVSRVTTSALDLVDAKYFDDYLDMGEPEIRRRYEKMKTTSSDGIEKYMAVQSYITSEDDLNWLCNTQNMAIIYVIIPDSDYNNYTSVFNCLNKSSTLSRWELGHRTQTSSVEYREAYKRIYEDGSDKEMVLRLTNLSPGSKPHITVMMPIKDSEGNIKGIMCVQRHVEGLIEVRQAFLQGVSGLTIMVIVVIIIITTSFTKKNMIAPLHKVAKEAERFSTENIKEEELLNQHYIVKEIESLAASIDKMETDTVNNIDHIKKYTKEHERLSAELELASEIQEGMLQKGFLTEVKGFDIHASMVPAKEVGGDFYDYFMIDDTHLAFLIADVSDKGIGAAFFMAISKTLIKSRALMGGSASEILAYTDRLISEKNPAGMFVTVWLGIIDLETGHVNSCNAGHDYPAIMKGEEYKIEKSAHSSPVAFIPGMTFMDTDFDLEPGDKIFLYTDGINEAKNAKNERFGTERILSVLNANKSSSGKEIIEKMKSVVDDFVGEEEQFDDMTMLSMEFTGIK